MIKTSLDFKRFFSQQSESTEITRVLSLRCRHLSGLPRCYNPLSNIFEERASRFDQISRELPETYHFNVSISNSVSVAEMSNALDRIRRALSIGTILLRFKKPWNDISKSMRKLNEFFGGHRRNSFDFRRGFLAYYSFRLLNHACSRNFTTCRAPLA